MPELRRLPPGQQATVGHVEPGYIRLDTYDVLQQHVVSHHFRFDDSVQAQLFRSPHRYVWPAELDLMAQLAGFELESRHADWNGTEFTAESRVARVGLPAAGRLVRALLLRLTRLCHCLGAGGATTMCTRASATTDGHHGVTHVPARGWGTMMGRERRHEGWALRESGRLDSEHTVLLLPGGLCTAAFYDDLVAEPRLRRGVVPPRGRDPAGSWTHAASGGSSARELRAARGQARP